MVTNPIYIAGGRWLAQIGSTAAVVPECEVKWAKYDWCRPDLLSVEFAKGLIRIVEIKESRGDYTGEIRNRKWEKYLLLADYFYFLVPCGLVKLNEVPDIAGLLYLEQNLYGDFEVKSIKRARRINEEERRKVREQFDHKWPHSNRDIKIIYEAMLRSYHNKYWYNSYAPLKAEMEKP